MKNILFHTHAAALFLPIREYIYILVCRQISVRRADVVGELHSPTPPAFRSRKLAAGCSRRQKYALRVKGGLSSPLWIPRLKDSCGLRQQAVVGISLLACSRRGEMHASRDTPAPQANVSQAATKGGSNAAFFNIVSFLRKNYGNT